MTDKTLFFEYKSHCPRCLVDTKHFLLEENLLGGEGKCACGYVGMIDLKLTGRTVINFNGKTKWGPLINLDSVKNIVDKT